MNNRQEEFELKAIRNIGIIAHIDAGKTTVSEKFLYLAGKSHSVGSIDEGTTVLDFLEEERRRGITISSAAASFKWQYFNQNYLIHLIDTPGHIDFTAEVERSLRICDGALVIFSGVEGVEAQSEKVWLQSENYHIPKIAFINKLDRLGASFERCFKQITNKFKAAKPLLISMPAGEEKDLSAIIDLIKMEAIYFTGDNGKNINYKNIPDRYKGKALFYRDILIQNLADYDDEIAEAYLDNKILDEKIISQAIRKLTFENKIVPVLCGSAKKSIGIQPLLNAVIKYLPSPEINNQIKTLNSDGSFKEKIRISNPIFSALAFKITAGESSSLIYLRTYSGQIKTGDTIQIARTGKKVKIKKIFRLYAKQFEEITHVGPGDIIGITGNYEIKTGDTICSFNKKIFLEKISFPEPVMSIAIEAKSIKDKEKTTNALRLLCKEDPTLFLKKNEATDQSILSGMGELHLEIALHRLAKEFHLQTRHGKPRVAYRETIEKEQTITGHFQKIINSVELNTSIDISFTPNNEIQGNIVENLLPNNIAKSWQKAAFECLENSLNSSGNLGYSLTKIAAKIKAIKGTLENTSEISIAAATTDAFRKMLLQGTIMLEPLMKLEIIAPENYIGDISSYLQPKQATILAIEQLDQAKKIQCTVPLAEMFGFSQALPKLTGGRGSFSMEPAGYKKLQNSNNFAFN